MKTVKFKEAGRWADSNPLLPQFEVEAGEEALVTNDLADIIVEAGKGKIIPADKMEDADIERKEAEAIAAGEESDAVKQITASIAALVSEKDFLSLDLAGKSSEELAINLADLEAAKKAEEDAAAKKAGKNPATKDKGKAESK